MHDTASLISALPEPGLPPGRLIQPDDGGAPAFWISDSPVGPEFWPAWHAVHRQTGLWPLLVIGQLGYVKPADPGDVLRIDSATRLRSWWADYTRADDLHDPPPDLLDLTAPFGIRWPGPHPAIPLSGLPGGIRGPAERQIARARPPPPGRSRER